MPTSYKVTFWDHRHRPDRRKPWMVRWTVNGREFSESYLTKTQADGRKAELLVAAASHQPFDTETGLPLTELRRRQEEQNSVTWYQHGRNYVEARWDGAPAKTRTTWADALASVTFELVKSKTGMPDKLLVRRALYSWAFNVNRWTDEPPAEVAKALVWVARNSVDVSELADPKMVRRLLAALSVRLDGTKAAASTTLRKRRILNHVLGRAVEDGLLAANPLSSVQWQPPRTEEEVDPEYVMSPEQAAAMLEAVGRQGGAGRDWWRSSGACTTRACVRVRSSTSARTGACCRRRAGEAQPQREQPRVGSSWTDSGASHDPRSLKHRPEKATRPVPIPPELVKLLREHIDQHGTAPDGRLFRTFRNGMVQESGYGVVWAAARAEVFNEEERATPLAKRPYDARHAGISLWLASGVPVAECARRAGHSIAVLLRVYAKCIHGDEDHANRLITERLQRRPAPRPAPDGS
ncbi:tyrosine-type recombinase/integrase [Kitasatospora aburaviensis]